MNETNETIVMDRHFPYVRQAMKETEPRAENKPVIIGDVVRGERYPTIRIRGGMPLHLDDDREIKSVLEDEIEMVARMTSPFIHNFFGDHPDFQLERTYRVEVDDIEGNTEEWLIVNAIVHPWADSKTHIFEFQGLYRISGVKELAVALDLLGCHNYRLGA